MHKQNEYRISSIKGKNYIIGENFRHELSLKSRMCDPRTMVKELNKRIKEINTLLEIQDKHKEIIARLEKAYSENTHKLVKNTLENNGDKSTSYMDRITQYWKKYAEKVWMSNTGYTVPIKSNKNLSANNVFKKCTVDGHKKQIKSILDCVREELKSFKSKKFTIKEIKSSLESKKIKFNKSSLYDALSKLKKSGEIILIKKGNKINSAVYEKKSSKYTVLLQVTGIKRGKPSRVDEADTEV